VYKTTVKVELKANEMIFASDRCFTYDNSIAEQKCLDVLITHLEKKNDLAFYVMIP
jgi:hypothetical protein